MLPQSASFSMKAIWRSAVQPSWRARTGTGWKVMSGLCSDIRRPAGKEAKHLPHVGVHRTADSNVCFGWIADTNGSRICANRLRQSRLTHREAPCDPFWIEIGAAAEHLE